MKNRMNIVDMQQVHGSRVVRVSKKDVGRKINKCDALITSDPEIYLRISVADCIPLTLYDPITNSIGIVHAGWRGLKKKIIVKTIKAMKKEFSTSSENIVAEVGPHICQKHYEVGKEFADIFCEYSGVLMNENGKFYLDIGKVCIEQLIDSGVLQSNIKYNDKCTFEDPLLPSYRGGDRQKRKQYLLKIPNPS